MKRIRPSAAVGSGSTPLASAMSIARASAKTCQQKIDG
jgi:hypothetical protein